MLSVQVTIYDIIETPGKAWAHVREEFFFHLHSTLTYYPKLHIRGEPQEGKPFDIECIYQFAFTGDSTDYRFKSIIDFVDSKAFAAMG